jgi:hypothetical protein
LGYEDSIKHAVYAEQRLREVLNRVNAQQTLRGICMFSKPSRQSLTDNNTIERIGARLQKQAYASRTGFGSFPKRK